MRTKERPYKRLKQLSHTIMFLVITLCVAALSAMPGGGPTSPETAGFKSAGANELVDPFSGDFSYSIPLMEIGGYPINLSYSSSLSMDQEPSWVGLGWTLNPGAVNRQMRGLPDDFNGDTIFKKIGRKDNWTGTFMIGPKFKIAKSPLSYNISAGLSYNNFTGFNTTIGSGLSIELLKGLNLSTNFATNTESGADIDVSASYDFFDKKVGHYTSSITANIGFGVNSREGAKYMSYGFSASRNRERHIVENKGKFKVLGASNGSVSASSNISFSTPTFAPSSPNQYKSKSYSLSFGLGSDFFIANADLDVKGTYSVNYLRTNLLSNPAYGNLYMQNGVAASDVSLFDFNKEKDLPFSNDRTNFISIPVLTFDNFTVSQQHGGGSYRTKRSDVGILSDPTSTSTNLHIGLGGSIASGNWLDGHAAIDGVDGTNINNKWIDNNEIKDCIEFKGKEDILCSNKFDYEPCYFVNTAELHFNENSNFIFNQSDKFRFDPIRIAIDNSGKAYRMYDKHGGVFSISDLDTNLLRRNREKKNSVFSFLTLDESKRMGLQKVIPDYFPPGQLSFLTNCLNTPNRIMEFSKYGRGHHMGQITVIGEDGTRAVFGLPVYNIIQQDVSFAVDNKNVDALRPISIVDYSAENESVNNRAGIDGYYIKESMPSYSHSHLLTGFLSSDYQDLTGDGISEDDLGDAVKFNYFTPEKNVYKWRIPYDYMKATYQPNLVSDTEDDKASFTYGEKQLVYLHSIESKTAIAVFYSSPRNLEGFGVAGYNGGKDTSIKQFKLDSIALFSKSEIEVMKNKWSFTLDSLTPIKKVVFEYDYSLCKGIPNSIGSFPNNGKLTLKRVYFKFGKNNRRLAYKFDYNGLNPDYNVVASDRWGNYKPSTANPNSLLNDEFPYSLQKNHVLHDSIIHKNAAPWALTDIGLPTGGLIKIKYEADDYAYVQNREAMQLFQILGFSNRSTDKPSDNLYKTNFIPGLLAPSNDYIHFQLPVSVANANEFIDKYLDGTNHHYFKANIPLFTKSYPYALNKEHIAEYVTGYLQFDNNDITVYDSGNKVSIKMLRQDGHNPMSYAGWKFYKNFIPHKFFPGQVRNDEANVPEILMSFLSHMDIVNELIIGIDRNAKSKGYCFGVDLNKAFVRLKNPWRKKYGGGHRVARISTIDNWENVTLNGKNSEYGQDYYYTDTIKGQAISSGVAAYEPILGGEENPLKLPNSIKENTATFFMEEPFGESFFPGASVGYSKVRIIPFGSYKVSKNPIIIEEKNGTGGFEKRFFTWKDFPVITKYTPLERELNTTNIPALFYNYSSKDFYLSQGYYVELNNMHGMTKAEYTFNKDNQFISFKEYKYKTDSKNKLDNNVKVLDKYGNISEKELGVDIEVFNEMKRSKSSTTSLALNVNVGCMLLPLIIPPFPRIFPLVTGGENYAECKSTSTVKFVQRKAILEETKSMSNGSTVTSSNVLFDENSGKPIVVSTTNAYNVKEFDVSYPARYAYEGLSGAYINSSLRFFGVLQNGLLETLLHSGTPITFSQSGMQKYFYPGDEFFFIDTNYNPIERRLWVAKFGNDYKFIDSKGKLFPPAGASLVGNIVMIRPGRRNIIDATVGKLLTFSNPVTTSPAFFKNSVKDVINASAAKFSDSWRTNNSGFLDVSYGTSMIQMLKLCDDFESLNLPIDFSYYLIRALAARDAMMLTSGTYSLWDIVLAYYPKTNTIPYISPSTNIHWDHIKAAMDPIKFYCDVSGTFSTINVSDYRAHFGNYNSTFKLTFCQQIKSNPLSPGGIEYHDFSGTPLSDLVLVENDLLNNLMQFSPVTCDPLNETLSDYYVNGNRLNKVSRFVFDRATKCDDINSLHVNSEFSTCFKDMYVNIKSSEGDYYINPYLNNLLGDWRNKANFSFNYQRNYSSSFVGTNYYKNGKIDSIDFWKFSGSSFGLAENSKQIRNYTTNYDSKGNVIETKNALNIYSALKYGYMKTLTTVVAENSKYQNLFFDGFEESKFNLSCKFNNGSDLFSKNYSWLDYCGSNAASISDEEAHTGRYSLRVESGNSGECAIKLYEGNCEGDASASASNGIVYNKSNILSEFNPEKDKVFIISAWIKKLKGCDPDNKYKHVTISLLYDVAPQKDITIELQGGKMVEEWQQINDTFIIPAAAASMAIKLTADTGVTYFDDVRIFPIESNMKSFVYDPFNLRHVADLDENNFATFYDYDEAGNLIRRRKETERGIMTIKEERIHFADEP